MSKLYRFTEIDGQTREYAWGNRDEAIEFATLNNYSVTTADAYEEAARGPSAEHLDDMLARSR